MAINATAVWRIRTGGSSLNGAGYDSAISGAGTDYSTQDAAQLSVTDGATSGAGSTTLTSATGGFTAAMIGNAVRIASGTNFQVGYYFITARTDTNTVTLDRTPSSGGAGSGGNVKVGGAQRQPGDSLYNSVVAGNTVYLRASAGNASSYPTASLDYTISSFFTPTAGTEADGNVKWIGENGIPTIDSPGLGFYNCAKNYFENLYLVATSAGNPTFGIINGSDLTLVDVVLNQNNQAAMVGANLNNPVIRGGEIYGGTTTPTASAGAFGLEVGTYSGSVHGLKIRYCRDHGIRISGSGGGLDVRDCRIYRCVGNGIHAAVLSSTSPLILIGNTIDANKGHGIRLDAANSAIYATIRNNQITNHTEAGKAGISCATSNSDRRKRAWGYNNVYNNTSNYENCTADSTDLSADPQYTDAAGGDFTPGNAAMLAGYPTNQGQPFGTVNNDVWIGAVQKDEPAGGAMAVIKRRVRW